MQPHPHSTTPTLDKIMSYIFEHYIELFLSTVVAFVTFILSYFYDLTLTNLPQFIGLSSAIVLDGVLGMISGIKKEGFQTFKALKIVKDFSVWNIFLGVILSIEKGYPGAGWLSETIMIPVIVFNLISALKNASLIGLVKNEIINSILDKIDQHKGERKS
jgi:hypothetical protein